MIMKKLYCPWREKYSKTVSGTKQEKVTKDECVFCAKFAQTTDDKNYVIQRFKHCAVLMNLYPYNAGHLLVIPYQHAACLSELSNDERNELMYVSMVSSDVLKSTLGAQGVNMGLNVGRAAGAGIPSHIHIHILPRWIGDTNFMPLLAETKTISFDMQQIYLKLKAAF